MVYAPVTLRQKRVFQRDKISRNDFNDRISKQIKLEEKVKWADFVIDNKKSLEDLKKNSRKVFDILIKKVKTKYSDQGKGPKRRRRIKQGH